MEGTINAYFELLKDLSKAEQRKKLLEISLELSQQGRLDDLKIIEQKLEELK